MTADAFQKNVLKTVLQLEKVYFDLAAQDEDSVIVVCDRGAMDPSACMRLCGVVRVCRVGVHSIDKYGVSVCACVGACVIMTMLSLCVCVCRENEEVGCGEWYTCKEQVGVCV